MTRTKEYENLKKDIEAFCNRRIENFSWDVAMDELDDLKYRVGVLFPDDELKEVAPYKIYTFENRDDLNCFSGGSKGLITFGVMLSKELQKLIDRNIPFSFLSQQRNLDSVINDLDQGANDTIDFVTSASDRYGLRILVSQYFWPILQAIDKKIAQLENTKNVKIKRW